MQTHKWRERVRFTNCIREGVNRYGGLTMVHYGGGGKGMKGNQV